MAVSPSQAEELVSQFRSEVDRRLQMVGLEGAKNSTRLSEVNSITTGFEKKIMAAFTLPDTTYAMLLTEYNYCMSQVNNAISNVTQQQNSNLMGLAAPFTGSPADSPAWNKVIAFTGAEIDRLVRVYGEQLANMPTAMRSRLDADLSRLLDSIEEAYAKNASEANANAVHSQIKSKLGNLEKDLDGALQAALTASLENLSLQKSVQLQEMESGLLAVDQGMQPAHQKMWRTVVNETRSLINSLKHSNYVSYDKKVREQKIAVIDAKLGVLDNMRMNADTRVSALSGFYGNSGHRVHSKRYSPGATLGYAHSKMTATPKSSFKTKPPGFAGYSGKAGDSDHFF